MIERLKLQLIILQLQLQVLILRKKLTIPKLPQPKIAVVHHGGGFLDFNGVNEYHKQKWGFRSSLGYYAGYHRFIEYDGTRHIARRDNERGAHTVEPGRPGWWNDNSVGICLQGNLETHMPTPSQIKALEKDLKEFDEIKMHSDIVATICPGKHIKNWFKK